MYLPQVSVSSTMVHRVHKKFHLNCIRLKHRGDWWESGQIQIFNCTVTDSTFAVQIGYVKDVRLILKRKIHTGSSPALSPIAASLPIAKNQEALYATEATGLVLEYVEISSLSFCLKYYWGPGLGLRGHPMSPDMIRLIILERVSSIEYGYKKVDLVHGVFLNTRAWKQQDWNNTKKQGNFREEGKKRGMKVERSTLGTKKVPCTFLSKVTKIRPVTWDTHDSPSSSWSGLLLSVDSFFFFFWVNKESGSSSSSHHSWKFLKK